MYILLLSLKRFIIIIIIITMFIVIFMFSTNIIINIIPNIYRFMTMRICLIGTVTILWLMDQKCQRLRQMCYLWSSFQTILILERVLDSSMKKKVGIS